MNAGEKHETFCYQKLLNSRYYYKTGCIPGDGEVSEEFAGKWYPDESANCCFVPVKENEEYMLQNRNPSGKLSYVFLTEKTVGEKGETPFFAPGYEKVLTVDSGEKIGLSIPAGVRYLVVFDRVGSSEENMVILKLEEYIEKNNFNDVFHFTTGNFSEWYNQRRSYVTLTAPDAENENIDNVLAIQNTSKYGVPGNCCINFLDSAGTEKCAIGYSHNSTIDGYDGYYPDTCYIEIGNAFSTDRNSDVKLSVISTRHGVEPRQIVIMTVQPNGQIDIYPNASGEGTRVTIHGDLEVTGKILQKNETGELK